VAKDFSGAKPLRKKLQYWLQGRIQKYTKYKGHAEGTRFSRALARGPSEHAYVGSGKVHRIGNRQITVFSEGQKIYNADLSASYNIGARHWIREIADHSKKAWVETLRSCRETKIPSPWQDISRHPLRSLAWHGLFLRETSRCLRLI